MVGARVPVRSFNAPAPTRRRSPTHAATPLASARSQLDERRSPRSRVGDAADRPVGKSAQTSIPGRWSMMSVPTITTFSSGPRQRRPPVRQRRRHPVVTMTGGDHQRGASAYHVHVHIRAERHQRADNRLVTLSPSDIPTAAWLHADRACTHSRQRPGNRMQQANNRLMAILRITVDCSRPVRLPRVKADAE
jgi:hypothetical protein